MYLYIHDDELIISFMFIGFFLRGSHACDVFAMDLGLVSFATRLCVCAHVCVLSVRSVPWHVS